MPDDKESDEIRDVLIVGIENQTRALAERLVAHNWRVMLVDTDGSYCATWLYQVTFRR